jgi:GNAT superfamily N-acetyltransferase
MAFAAAEAQEAEGIEKAPATLRRGIETALHDETVAVYWVLVVDDDQPVGTISALREWSNWNAGYYWWIQSMYIVPEYRGKGLALQLLDTVGDEARRRGGLELRLCVHEGNVRAMKTYDAAGFSESKYKVMSRAL